MEHVEAHRFFNIRHDLSRALTRKKEKNVERFLVLDLTFSRHGDKLSVDSGSVANGDRYPNEYARRGSPEEANRILDTFEPIENIYFDKEGLHFFYNEYDIDFFGAGTFDICIDWPLPRSVTGIFTPAE